MSLNSGSSRIFSLIRWRYCVLLIIVDIKFSGLDVFDGFDGFFKICGL